MTYEEACNRVAGKMGLPRSLVRKAYHAYWHSIRGHITSLPLKEDLTDEEFLRLRPNVNIPSIGKLYVTLDRYHRMKKRFRILNDLRNAAHKED